MYIVPGGRDMRAACGQDQDSARGSASPPRPQCMLTVPQCSDHWEKAAEASSALRRDTANMIVKCRGRQASTVANTSHFSTDRVGGCGRAHGSPGARHSAVSALTRARRLIPGKGELAGLSSRRAWELSSREGPSDRARPRRVECQRRHPSIRDAAGPTVGPVCTDLEPAEMVAQRAGMISECKGR
jgi:hypothetical protein